MLDKLTQNVQKNCSEMLHTIMNSNLLILSP